MKKIISILLLLSIFVIQDTNVYANSTYYKNQLNDQSKKYYSDLKNNFITNKGDAPIKYLLNEYIVDSYLEDEIAVYLKNIKLAYSAAYLDHPEYYWMKACVISYSGKDYYDDVVNVLYTRINDINVLVKSGGLNSSSNKKKYNKAFKRAVKKVNKIRGKNKSKYNTLKAINKYVSTTIKYSNKKNKPFNTHTAYGAFVKKKAVCDGYSKAFKALCDYYKIPCLLEIGYVYKSTGHAWNIVKLKGKWYYVDSTWNKSSKNRFFLAGSKLFNKTHIHNKKKMDVLSLGVFKTPKVSKSNY